MLEKPVLSCPGSLTPEKDPVENIGEKPLSKKTADYKFTVFIPTFNRARTLPGTLESIENQTFKDFEVVIIDDGSTDNTAELVKTWSRKTLIDVQYVYQKNRGKPSAHNRALEISRGYFFINLDSDDSLLPDALETIWKNWELIPEEEKPSFAGIGGLCLKDNGLVCGTGFPQDTMDSNYLEISRDHRLRGEKREAILTSILKKYPYPILDGEKHIRPSMILRRLSLDYRIRFINQPLQINRHASDGIMANRFSYRMRNPKGLRLCFLEEITLFAEYSDRKKLYRNTVRYIRYSLHSLVGIQRQAREVKYRWIWVFALPEGISDWMVDLIRKQLRGI